MTETGSRQVRRALERAEASPPCLRTVHPKGNRSSRRAARKVDSEIIIRPTSLNAVASCKRTRRDYRIRNELRPARGMVHPRTISMRRMVAIRCTALIFAIAAKRAEERRIAT